MSPRNKHFAWGAIAACSLRMLGWLAVNALAAAGVHVCVNPTEAGEKMVEIVRAL